MGFTELISIGAGIAFGTGAAVATGEGNAEAGEAIYSRCVACHALGYAGVTDPRERADFIAYLEQAGSARQCR